MKQNTVPANESKTMPQIGYNLLLHIFNSQLLLPVLVKDDHQLVTKLQKNSNTGHCYSMLHQTALVLVTFS